MNIQSMSLSGVLKMQPQVFLDQRGFFYESFSEPLLRQFGLPSCYVQDNHSFSSKGVLRGMHFQKGQAKLINVIVGVIYDVFVDIRKGSSTFGRWEGIILDARDKQLLFIPDGYAHGFYVISDEAHLIYKVSQVYNPAEEASFRYDDPYINIDWPEGEKILSIRDQGAPLFSEVIL